jgi:hypothetical protein
MMEPPPLTGTPAQIARAERIRGRRLPELEEQEGYVRRAMDHHRLDFSLTLQAIEAIRQQRQAA